jgi:hypothetical protein
MAMTAEEAEFVLRAIVSREQRRFQQLMKPYLHELFDVLRRKPPSPIAMPDGRVTRYVGPTADDLGGPYRAPRWLEELCLEDYDVMRDLGRYRERNK